MYRKFLGATIAALFIVIGLAAPVRAQTTFGSQPTFTFGGTGIPNDAVVWNSNAAAVGVTFGLSATARCAGSPQVCGPTVTNDGVNTFYAAPGILNSDATWNFDWEITGANAGDFTYQLLYDFNPAVGNSGDLGALNLSTLSDFNDSENLSFGYLSLSVPGFISPPSGSFDANASGEYYFLGEAFNANGDLAFSVPMYVDAGQPVPEPGTLSLLAMGLVGLGGAGMRKRRQRA